MSDLSQQLSFAVNDELALLLALNREDNITHAQLQRLDLLLERRDQQIEAQLQVLHYHQQHAA